MGEDREKWEGNYLIVEFLLRARLQEYLSHSKEENVIYVTDLVRCPLKVKFEREYKELIMSEILSPSAILGDLVHKGLESILKIEGYEIFSEVEKEKIVVVDGKEFKIKGRADVILKKENELIILEIKTARRDEGIPQRHHILQLRIYLWLFDANKGILLYITPDRVTEFPIEGAIETNSVIRMVEENLKLSPSPRYSWECSYCIFSKICPNKVK